jgi:ATP-dependent RNA helicase RhlE
MLFSATFPREIRDLADSLLDSPTEIQVAARNTAAELISQVAHPVDRTRKRELLSYMIGEGDWRQVLVFTRTKHGANRLSKQLTQDGHSATAIHGNKSQSARTQALADFKDGRVRILVATDIAARGLDIVRLPHVVNFDMPLVPEDYVHRIGRTGRAGLDGRAVSLVSVDEKGLLQGIERLLKRDIERVVIPGFEPNGGFHAAPAERGNGRGNSRGNGRGNSRGDGPGNSRGDGRNGHGGRSGRSREDGPLTGERWGRGRTATDRRR